MSNPSLLCVPYRFKTSKLYSQIPDSGLGDFVVTRSASNSATRVNAAGLIELVADNVPRLDYPLGGITAGCPALLVEPLAQNALQRSSEFENAYWGKQNGANVTLNDAISPDGTLNADRINLVSGSVISRVERAGLAYLASTDYTLSFFLKNIALTAGQTFAIRLEGSGGFDLVGTVTLFSNTISVALSGTAVTGFVSGSQKSTVENYGNGWYRYSISLRTGTTAGNATVYLITNVDANRSFHAWGAQLEASSVPTSYIPTAASPVTRGADTVEKTGVSSLIGQTEGTIYCEFEFPNTDKGDVIRIDSGNDANVVEFISQNTTTQRARIRASSGSYNVINASPPNMAINTRFKLAIAYKTGDSALYINGTSQATHTAAFTFNSALTRITLGQDIAVGRRVLRIFAAALYPTRLPNTGPNSLQSLTQ